MTIRTIYRFENDLQIGPYRTPGIGIPGKSSDKHPLPDIDGIRMDRPPIAHKQGWGRHDYRFAFETMTQLFQWFDHVNWLKELQESEFYVVTIRVGDSNIVRGGTQLAYRERDILVRPRRQIEWDHVWSAFARYQEEGRA